MRGSERHRRSLSLIRLHYLRHNDATIQRIMNAVEMPDRLAENLVRYIRSNSGKLSRRRREGEFNRLTDAEAALLEGIVNDAFEGFEGGPERADLAGSGAAYSLVFPRRRRVPDAIAADGVTNALVAADVLPAVCY